MRGVVTKTILAAVIAGSTLVVATQASAHDSDRWERWEHKHHWKHSHGYGPPSRVIVERPVYVAAPRPVYVAPVAPMVPMAPAYGYGGGGGYHQDPSVNFNFSFPMR
jgi:hypothetical protein